MVAMARSSGVDCVSTSFTRRPAAAAVWAMPLPMVPAPITANVVMAIGAIPPFINI